MWFFNLKIKNKKLTQSFPLTRKRKILGTDIGTSIVTGIGHVEVPIFVFISLFVMGMMSISVNVNANPNPNVKSEDGGLTVGPDDTFRIYSPQSEKIKKIKKTGKTEKGEIITRIGQFGPLTSIKIKPFKVTPRRAGSLSQASAIAEGRRLAQMYLKDYEERVRLGLAKPMPKPKTQADIWEEKNQQILARRAKYGKETSKNFVMPGMTPEESEKYHLASTSIEKKNASETSNTSNVKRTQEGILMPNSACNIENSTNVGLGCSIETRKKKEDSAAYSSTATATSNYEVGSASSPVEKFTFERVREEELKEYFPDIK